MQWEQLDCALRLSLEAPDRMHPTSFGFDQKHSQRKGRHVLNALHTPLRLHKKIILFIFVSLVLLHTWVPAAAAGLNDTDVLQQRQAMHSSAVNDIQATSMVPYYTIDGTVNPDPKKLTFTATETIVYTNRTSVALQNIGLRLYPNLTDVGGSCILTTVKVDGSVVTPKYGPQRYFVTVPLAQKLAAGKSVTLQIGFTTTAPTNADSNLFGTLVWDGTTLSMPYAYPMIAYLRGGMWDTTIPDSKGDIVSSEVSMYDVTLRGPSRGYTFVSTGSTLNTNTTGAEQSVRIYSGLQRDFAFALTKLIKKSQTVAGTTINVYGPASRASVTNAALAAAVAAVPIFNARIGQYPYNELDIISVDAGDFWGIEFPSFVLIEQDQYKINPDFEHLIVHEVGHQWFYNVIGNDVQRDAFVDEGLANYTELLYDQARNRATDAAGTIRYWKDDLDALRDNGNDGIVDQSIDVMSDDQYSTLSYSKAALYIDGVRLQIGEAAFATALKSYFTASKYRNVDGTAFRSAAQTACNCNLVSLYTQWILLK